MGKLYVTTTLFDVGGNPLDIVTDVINCSSQVKADAAIAILDGFDTEWTTPDANGVERKTGSQITRVVYCPSL